VHRLDNDTSGLVVAARTPTVRATLRERWSTPEVRKRYLAWVHGRVSSAGAHDAPIAHAGARRMAIDSRGRPATTRYTPRDAPHDDMTLLEIELIGGVRHQIRVHLADRGHPVLGDTLYGLPEPGASRLLLHAWRIDMPHPVDAAQRLAIEAPPPDDFTP
jgi:23S rRNA-/tRNA-specific pseudouridylate synthase